MDNKNIIFIDKNKNYTKHSVETIHSNRLNNWNGWMCAAGIRSIYIDFDGNIWRGTCQEGGWIGNINVVTGIHHGPELVSGTWIKCGLDVCSCGADMAVPKVKNVELIDAYFKDTAKRRSTLELDKEVPSVDAEVVYPEANEFFRSVIWDLGRLCNFDCHYCSKNSHNNFDPVKNLKYMKSAFENINKYWNKTEERIKFSITGGEPTVYKDYLPFVKYLKELDHVVHTTTNGSNTASYYSELAEYSDICFSIHLNYVKSMGLDKFVDNVRAAVETTEKGYDLETIARFNWTIVRIMLDPGNLETAKQAYSAFSEFKKYRNFVLTVDLVHEADTGHDLYKYSEEEISWIKSL